MGEMKNARRVLVGKCQRKSHLGYLNLDWRIILKWKLRKLGCELA